jgi:hypothetical protein
MQAAPARRDTAPQTHRGGLDFACVHDLGSRGIARKPRAVLVPTHHSY